MNQKHKTIKLKSGDTAIVGYGSLFSIESITRTLRRKYKDVFIHCGLKGWRRSWDVAMPNRAYYYTEGEERIYPQRILYLNVRPDLESQINGVLFVVKEDELKAMHDREWIYNPVEVTSDLTGVRVEGGEAFIYSGRNEYIAETVKSTRDAAIRASYLQDIVNALQYNDPLFRSMYEPTTGTVPKHLVIEDHLDPDRPNPWADAGRNYRPGSGKNK